MAMAEDAKADYLDVKRAIGSTDANIIFVRRFKIDGKHDAKNEHKILAITSCRIFVITKKAQGGSKIDSSFHILDLHELDSSKPMNLNVTVNFVDKQYQFGYLFANQEDVDKAASYMIALLKSNFVNANIEEQVSVKTDSPAQLERILHQTDLIVQSLSDDGQPCGSFALAYICLCDYFNQSSLAEVIWDVNKIYSSHNCKDFKLEDFECLEQRELIPLITTLGYNTWFTKLTISSYKLTNELVDAIIKAVKRSPSLEEIVITDAHLNKDHIIRLSLALSSNLNKVITKIDLSKNNIEDKGLSSIAGCMNALTRGLESLCIKEAGITSKGVSIFANALKANKFIFKTLLKLDLSGNALKADGAQSLCDFLAQPNALETLNLSETESALDLIFGALLRGCQQYLQNIYLSGNPFSYRKAKETQTLPSLQQFFGSSRALKSADLSNTKLTSQAVKAIFLGLANNPILTNVSLDLSHNELKSTGCAEICSCVKDVRCLTALNLSDNGLDQDFVQLCEALEKTHSLKDLDLSQNITKSKYNNAISEAIANMVMSETLHLEKLSIADCKLRLDAAALLDCIGTNETLTSINISGNGIGDIGARLIAKALQINTKLREIYLDKNGVTHKGLQDIARAMERNFSLHSIPLPINDLTVAMKHYPETNKYYAQIEKALTRNQSLATVIPGQAYKVHQGLLITSIDDYTQFTDSLVVELQDLCQKHRHSIDENIRNELKHATCLIKETVTFRQVLLELYSDPESAKKMLDEKFSHVASDFSAVVEGVLKVKVDDMLNTARKICPKALDNEEKINLIKQDLVKEGLIDKIAFQNSFVQLGKADLVYILCESNLSTANSIGEHLKKMLIEALQQSINILGSVVSQPRAEQTTTKETEEVKKELVEGGKTAQEKTVEEIQEKTNAAVAKKETKQEYEKSQSGGVLEETHEKEFSLINTTTPTMTTDQPESLPLSPSKITAPKPQHELLLNKTDTSDMSWELTAGNRLSVMLNDNQFVDDDDSNMAAYKARSRLSTIAQSEARSKSASLKRRPTFFRAPNTFQEVEIDISVEKDILSSSTNSLKTRYSSGDELDEPKAKEEQQLQKGTDVDMPQQREKLQSVGGFDVISANASQLKVTKDRAKPIQGRRAPSRVANLAHMNQENIENYLEEQSTKNDSPKITPRPRPASAMPSVNFGVDAPAPILRTESEKVKKPIPPTKKPEKKDDSKKEKSKKPTGGIQLPSLPGFFKRKDRSLSKSNTSTEDGQASDVVDEKTSECETVTEQCLNEEVEQPEPSTEKPQPSEEPKSEPTKRSQMMPKIGLPMAGGSALLAEMKRKQNQDEESKPAPAPPLTTKSKPAPPSTKPDRRDSIPARANSMSKPLPPKRPPSLRKRVSSDPANENEANEEKEDESNVEDASAAGAGEEAAT